MTINDLWCEKYRPKTLDEMCLDKPIRDRIEAWGTKIPHLLLLGHAGIGKTTLARIFIQEILKCDYLYINASDENGVETMRTKVSGFVQTKSFDGNIKVVVLDEADSISLAGQDILRNMMESYADTARFILTGNYKHKISTPIKSRCQSIELKYSLRDAVGRCISIAKTEGCIFEKEDPKKISELVRRFFPDLRLCINELQKCCIGGHLIFSESINNEELVNSIWKNITTSKTLELRKYLIQNEQLFNSDWDTLMKSILDTLYDLDIEDFLKKRMIIIIADHLEKSTRVIDKEINFTSCVLSLEVEHKTSTDN